MSEEKPSKYFGRGSSSKAASDLMKSNPSLYALLKEQAIQENLIARSEHLNPHYRDKFKPVQFSESELQILGEIPESVTDKYYRGQSNGSTDTLARLAEESPDHYAKVRAAAVLRNLVPASQRVTVPEPRPTNPFFTLSAELCAKAGLPSGYQCDQRGFERVVMVIADIAEKKREAEAVAAKAAAQNAKDRAVDASLATVGHIRETTADGLTQLAQQKSSRGLS